MNELSVSNQNKNSANVLQALLADLQTAAKAKDWEALAEINHGLMSQVSDVLQGASAEELNNHEPLLRELHAFVADLQKQCQAERQETAEELGQFSGARRAADRYQRISIT
ncbi:hypothetical protein GYB62_02600 [bacterium]|nr:hypothetical protein [bacterium]